MGDFFGALLVGRNVVDADVVAILGQAQGDGFAAADRSWLGTRRACNVLLVHGRGRAHVHAAGRTRHNGCLLISGLVLSRESVGTVLLERGYCCRAREHAAGAGEDSARD